MQGNKKKKFFFLSILVGAQQGPVRQINKRKTKQKLINMYISYILVHGRNAEMSN